MSNLEQVRTVVFDKNMNLILRSDPIFEILFGQITTLTQFTTFLAKNTMLNENFLTKLNISGQEYHVCYKTIDLEDTYEFQFFLLGIDWVIINPAGRDDIHDQLTGLLTQRSLISLLEHEIKRTAREKNIYTAILIDIAHLQDINEAFGYLAGDSIIKSVAETLDTQTRGSDSLGRYKGDKFIALLHNTDLKGANLYFEKLNRAIGSIKFRFNDLNFHIKVNYSLTSSIQDDTVDLLLARLESALIKSKEGSESHIEYFS